MKCEMCFPIISHFTIHNSLKIISILKKICIFANRNKMLKHQ